jgi:hypothetical protein
MIEVNSVNQLPLKGTGLKAAAVDTPAVGASSPGYSIEIAGWALAAAGAIERIEILHGDVLIRTAALSESRPDVYKTLGVVSRDAPGFRTRVGLLDLPLRPTLRVAAKIGGERRDIAEIVLQREPLHLTPPPPLHPLVLTTMGRSGSVWFSRLVGEHPAIVSYRPFESEPRVGTYWVQVLRALADPASIIQALAPQHMRGNWWLAPEEMGVFPPVHDPEVAQWLIEDHPERTARFCLESASDFYARVAAVRQKPDVVYYLEKYLPATVPAMLLELDPAAKEVFLVRDPRDQLASIVSWTSAGRARFSEEATTADEYIDWLAPRTKGLLRHWQARSARSLLVRYEDIVLDPVPTLTRLYDYLGLDCSPETVSGVVERAAEGQELQRGHQTSKSPAESVGRWRRDISPDLWDRLNEEFGPELENWYGDSRFPETTAAAPGAGSGI